jgi:hypothetical protein
MKRKDGHLIVNDQPLCGCATYAGPFCAECVEIAVGHYGWWTFNRFEPTTVILDCDNPPAAREELLEAGFAITAGMLPSVLLVTAQEV